MNIVQPVASGAASGRAPAHSPTPPPASLAGPPDRSAPVTPAQSASAIQPEVPPLRLGPDGQPLTGPPPAFQASLLELEADIENAIRRLAASRQEAWRGQPVSAGQPDAEAAPEASGLAEVTPGPPAETATTGTVAGDAPDPDASGSIRLP